MPTPIQVLIVEDERLYGDLLSEYLEALGYEPLGPVATATQALALFEGLQPDIVLLDVGLRGDTDGIALAAQLLARQPVPLIFITAATDRATFERARAVGPAAFITKPFDQRTVQNAVELALHNFALRAEDSAEAADPAPPGEQGLLLRDAFFVRDKEGLLKVPQHEALYVEAGTKYAVLVLANGRRYALRMTLRDTLRELAGHDFVQIHRSFVINARHLDRFNPVQQTVQVGGHELPLGRAYKDALLQRLHVLDGGEGA